jgi:NAD(P) transhydrogenase subunit alpha
MRIGLLCESDPLERRVSLTPDAVANLVEAGHEVTVHQGAGLRAGHDDAAYDAAGAAVVASVDAVLDRSELVVQVSTVPTGLGPDHTLIGLLEPMWRWERTAELATTGASLLALELVPRITRAQSMDVLSSMALVAGDQAVLLAAARSPKLWPLLMTAAGTVRPARVLVLGAGVAGLQAIATARRLGAVVSGYDVRPAAGEQIRSLGATAVELELPIESAEDESGYARAQSDAVADRQRAALVPVVGGADVVISTAAIPGAASPILITTEAVEAMAPGSVIVDLAAERGGNCELTKADAEVVHGGVTILGPTDLASRAAATASQLYATNVVNLVAHLNADGELVLDPDDEITTAMLVAAGGRVLRTPE